jgi:hypothetical protein
MLSGPAALLSAVALVGAMRLGVLSGCVDFFMPISIRGCVVVTACWLLITITSEFECVALSINARSVSRREHGLFHPRIKRRDLIFLVFFREAKSDAWDSGPDCDMD